MALPEPLIETTALAAPLLAELVAAGVNGPSAGSAARRLEDIASGGLTAAVGIVSGGASGPAAPVAGAVGADLLVLANSSTDSSRHGEIHLVDAASVTVDAVSSLDPTRRLGNPNWTPTPATQVLAGPEAVAAISRLADRAAVATAAELLGLTQRMIGLAAEYAKERHQFGKPIGSFQAVKHLLAGAQVQLEFARPVVYGAAWALDHAAPDASRAASVAKAYASDAATEAARVALQVHGAIGYTWECDLHLFLKRAWALAEAWGSAADHRTSVLDSLVAGR